jgi:hypothetical protein
LIFIIVVCCLINSANREGGNFVIFYFMSGFPAVTTKVSFQQRGKQRGYAQLPTVQPKGMVNRSLVEKKALEAIGRQRYLFIDFGVESTIVFMQIAFRSWSVRVSVLRVRRRWGMRI